MLAYSFLLSTGERSVEAGPESKGEGREGGHAARDGGSRWEGGCSGGCQHQDGSDRAGTAALLHRAPRQPHSTHTPHNPQAQLWALRAVGFSWPTRSIGSELECHALPPVVGSWLAVWLRFLLRRSIFSPRPAIQAPSGGVSAVAAGAEQSANPIDDWISTEQPGSSTSFGKKPASDTQMACILVSK